MRLRVAGNRCFYACFMVSPLCAGCGVDHLGTQERLDRGLVLVLPGIEGRSYWNLNLARGLDDGGVDCAIEIFDWGTPVPGGFLLNLMDADRNQAEAARLRRRILDYRGSHPGKSVQLVGHSGGAGIAVLAAERLPESVKLKSVTLLAAAVSPDYDLRPALRHIERQLLNWYSEQDNLLLGPGTTLMGNIDRVHAEGAGKVGFRLAPAESEEDRRLLSKVQQISWTPRMWSLGHDGGHFGWTNRYFVRTCLAPVISGNLLQTSGAFVSFAREPAFESTATNPLFRTPSAKVPTATPAASCFRDESLGLYRPLLAIGMKR